MQANYVETSSSATGRILSVLKNSGDLVGDRLLLVGEVVTSTIASDYPTLYKVFIQMTRTSQSILEFAKNPSPQASSTKEAEFEVETEKSSFQIKFCYGQNCSLADSRQVVKNDTQNVAINLKELIFGLAGALIFLLIVVYMVVLGQEKNLQETEDLLAEVIPKDQIDSQQIQKEKLRKEIELQNQSDLSLSEIKMMDDSIGFSAGGAQTYETLKADLELDASHDSAGF